MAGSATERALRGQIKVRPRVEQFKQSTQTEIRQSIEEVRRRGISLRAAWRADHVSSTPQSRPSEPDSRVEDAFAEAMEAFDACAAEFDLNQDERVEVLRKMLAATRRDALDRKSDIALPKTAPALWADRDRNEKENPVEFTRRVYARWLGRGLTRRLLRQLDDQLYRALSVWTYRHPEDTLAELPPMSAEMDELIERLSTELSLEDLRKLGYAIDTRLRRGSK